MFWMPTPTIVGLIAMLIFIDRTNSDDSCEDTNEQCRRWASVGECDKNPSYDH